MTATNYPLRQQARTVNLEIDALHKQLRQLEPIDLLSAASWQLAWDKHPELRARETALFQKLGEFQRRRGKP